MRFVLKVLKIIVELSFSCSEHIWYSAGGIKLHFLPTLKESPVGFMNSRAPRNPTLERYLKGLCSWLLRILIEVEQQEVFARDA